MVPPIGQYQTYHSALYYRKKFKNSVRSFVNKHTPPFLLVSKWNFEPVFISVGKFHFLMHDHILVMNELKEKGFSIPAETYFIRALQDKRNISHRKTLKKITHFCVQPRWKSIYIYRRIYSAAINTECDNICSTFLRW